QPQGELAGGAPGDSGDDRAAFGRHPQQLERGGAPRDGPAEPLRGLEVAPHRIRVNSIQPTGVNTPMNDGLAALEGLTPNEIAERSAGNLLPVPWVEPEDVA